jgi:hypothetical protein
MVRLIEFTKKQTGLFRFAVIYWSLYILFIICYSYLSKVDEYYESEKAQGVVTDMLESSGRRSSTSYYPQFQFIYRDSLYTSADNGTMARFKEIDDKVTVIFPGGRPEEAVIYTIISYWISLPAVLLSAAIATFFFAIPFIVRQYRLFKEEFRGR